MPCNLLGFHLTQTTDNASCNPNRIDKVLSMSNPPATTALERVGGQHNTPAALLPWKTRYPLYG